MTAPDRIWIDAWGGNWSPRSGGTQELEYVRRDPAVLAALPEVRDVMRRAYWLGMNAYTGESGAEEHERKKAACENDLDGIIAPAIRAKGANHE